MGEKTGVIFVEARVKEEIVRDPNVESINYDILQADLEEQLSSEGNCFELLVDILADDRDAYLKLGPYREQAKEVLHSLKVIEYQGPEKDETCYSSEHVTIKVNVYTLYDTPRSLMEDEEFPQAELTPLPHIRFENQWDDLIFEEDIKGDLIWMMTNILKFAARSEIRGDVNPLILLYGPPGTGKTSLCQGLAQRISVRLNSTYKRTRLVQIKTATLLSKYYSESARQVDEIFTKIACMCQEDPEQFVCVLIDEVESIASSREFSIKHGESQDSLRATNALLTGLDRIKSCPNVVFLCTSNMLEALDSAFLDRCGLKRSIDPPSLTSQYEILRSRIQKLIQRNVIQSEDVLPSYNDAVLESESYETEHPGCKLLGLVKLIRSGNSHSQLEREVSGRSLTQLTEQAILRYLRSDECDLNMALTFMKQSISSEYTKRRGAVQGKGEKVDAAKVVAEKKGPKRKWRIVFEEEYDTNTLDKTAEAIINQVVPSFLTSDPEAGGSNHSQLALPRSSRPYTILDDQLKDGNVTMEFEEITV